MALNTYMKSSKANEATIAERKKRDPRLESINTWDAAVAKPQMAPAQTPAPTPQAQPSPEPMGPSYTESALSQKRQLRNEIQYQQDMLRKDRMTKNLVQGSKDDADRLGNIHRLWAEYHAFEKAGAPVQQPGSVDSNFNSIRDASAQAAKIMQGDLAAMEQKVYTMPPGPQRDAEVEKLRAFKQRTNEQEVRGYALRPSDYGPPVPSLPGNTTNAYGDIRTEAAKATRGQSAMVGRQQQMRQEAYNFANTIQDKRLAEEAQAKQVKDEVFSAGIGAIRRPQDEFKMRQDQQAAEAASLRQKQASGEKMTEAEVNKTNAQTDAAKYAIDPNNPSNKLASAQTDYVTGEMKRTANLRAGNGQPQTAEEMAANKAKRDFASEQVGLTPELESTAMQAASSIASEMGGLGGDRYIGSMFTGNASGGIKAASQMAAFAKALDDLSKIDPQAAKNKARDFLANMPRKAVGAGESFTAATTGMLGSVGGIAAAPFTMGLSLLATAGAAAQQSAQMLNNQDKLRVVSDLNRTREILERLSQ